MRIGLSCGIHTERIAFDRRTTMRVRTSNGPSGITRTVDARQVTIRLSTGAQWSLSQVGEHLEAIAVLAPGRKSARCSVAPKNTVNTLILRSEEYDASQ